MYLDTSSHVPALRCIQDPLRSAVDAKYPERQARIKANGVSLDVLISGSAQGQPLLLIPGLGMQRTDWPEGLVALLVDAGFMVIQYDPRDVGLSEDMGHLGRANIGKAALGRMMGMRSDAPYHLADLADDAAELLSALHIGSAHVCGVSMGGMVAQHMAHRHAARVQSLTLMMTTSGSPWLPSASGILLHRLAARPPSQSDFPALLTHFVRMHGLIASPGWPEPAAELERRIYASLERSYRPQATRRQTVAVLADGDRSSILRSLDLPVHIMHGLSDLLVPAAAGRDLAKKIRGASLDEVKGMGHDLPAPLWPRMVAGICAVAGMASTKKAQ